MKVNFLQLSFKGVQVTGLGDKPELKRKFDNEHLRITSDFSRINDAKPGEVQPYMVRTKDGFDISSHLNSKKLRAKYDTYLKAEFLKLTKGVDGVKVALVNNKVLKQRKPFS